MSPELANFLFEAANFVVLASALGWLLFKPVRRALDADRERYAKDKADAEHSRGEAEDLLREARATVQRAEQEADQLRRDRLETASKEAALELEEARKTRAAERRALESELQAMRTIEAEALAETLGRIAAESLERLLSTLDGPSLDLALTRGACAQLETLPSAARQSAQVESARPLDAETRGLLEGSLGKSFQERAVPELGAGVRVTTAAGQVDATAASLARTAARFVSDTATAKRAQQGFAARPARSRERADG